MFDNLYHHDEVVVDKILSRSTVTELNPIANSFRHIPCIGTDNPSGIGKRGFQIEGIIGCIFMGAVRIGFPHRQAGRFVVGPHCRVSIRAF